MKSIYLLCPLVLAVQMMTASAEVFLLKDGTELTGKILREDETSYLLEIQVTKSIKDEKTIAKSSVLRVEKEQTELKEFEAIRALVPVADLQEAAEYDARITRVTKFLATETNRFRVEKAQQTLEVLKKEAAVIKASGVKIDGKLLTSSEREADVYAIDSRISELKTRNLIKNGQVLDALRMYANMDRDFKNTMATIDLRPEMIRQIKNYVNEAEMSLKSYDKRVKDRQMGLQRMGASDRALSEKALSDEAAALDARFKREKTAKIGWVTIHPFCKASLDETVSFGKQEITRLEAIKTTDNDDSGKVFRETLALIQSGANATAVTAAIRAADVALIAPRYVAMLKSAAEAKGIKP